MICCTAVKLYVNENMAHGMAPVEADGRDPYIIAYLTMTQIPTNLYPLRRVSLRSSSHSCFHCFVFLKWFIPWISQRLHVNIVFTRYLSSCSSFTKYRLNKFDALDNRLPRPYTRKWARTSPERGRSACQGVCRWFKRTDRHSKLKIQTKHSVCLVCRLGQSDGRVWLPNEAFRNSWL